MNAYFKILVILFFLFFLRNIKAQTIDSLSIVNANYDSLLHSDKQALTTLFYKHKNDVLINNLGTFGSSFYFPTAYSLYRRTIIELTNPFNSAFFALTGVKPYTNITYINASRREQLFSIKHLQEFGKLLLLDFDWKKISSPGDFNNQEANTTDFNGTLRFKNKEDNYRLEFSNVTNRYFYEENGGLSTISNFQNNLLSNERSYVVNLPTSNTYIKNYVYKLEQQKDLYSSSDSLVAKKIYLKHQIKSTSKKRVFFDTDPLSNIYNSINIDSISSTDSISVTNLSNTVSIGLSKDFVDLEFFGQYDKEKYFQSFGLDTTYNNFYLGVNGSYEKNDLNIKLTAKYALSGYRNKDFESELWLSRENKKHLLNVGVRYFLTQPELNYINYNSNHFVWRNYFFNKQSLLDIYFKFKLKKLDLEFSGESKLLNNTLYFNDFSLASQNDEVSSISTFSLSKNYKLFNFYFRTAFIYQFTSDEFIFPLPDLIGRQIVYYEKKVFKKTLKLQLGVGLSYSSRYYGYAYSPAITQFYTQRNIELGLYPAIDIFLNTQLKRAQIFLKYEHINSGSDLSRSLAAPNYPLLRRSLKFGISWNLFD